MAQAKISVFSFLSVSASADDGASAVSGFSADDGASAVSGTTSVSGISAEDDGASTNDGVSFRTSAKDSECDWSYASLSDYYPSDSS